MEQKDVENAYYETSAAKKELARIQYEWELEKIRLLKKYLTMQWIVTPILGVIIMYFYLF